ncbi:hypothetical protein KC929_00525 [Patescibacteria group bacterium]|nr:hypothetical protein [Patescibacteria group bacterium]
MNSNKLDKFIQEIESIKMTSFEKDEMRNQLIAFAMGYTPVVSPYQHVLYAVRRGVVIAFIAILSIGSVSNFASGQALPGDTLYPVKIAHEEIKLAATFDTKKKISYEIKRTEKRIKEATELATMHDLDDQTQDDIAEEIKKQTLKVKEHIEEVKVDDPEEALALNSELKSTIKANTEALRKVSTNPEKQKKDEDNSETPTVVTQADQPIPDYEVVEVSFAKNLLGHIDEEVASIETFEDEVSREITKEEDEITEDQPSDIETEQNTDDKEDVIKEREIIAKEIQSLEDILNLKAEIAEIRSSLTPGIEDADDFDQAAAYQDIDRYMKEKKYKKALVTLRDVLGHYQELAIKEELERELGIKLNVEKQTDPTTDEDIPLEPQESGMTIDTTDGTDTQAAEGSTTTARAETTAIRIAS